MHASIFSESAQNCNKNVLWNPKKQNFFMISGSQLGCETIRKRNRLKIHHYRSYNRWWGIWRCLPWKTQCSRYIIILLFWTRIFLEKIQIWGNFAGISSVIYSWNFFKAKYVQVSCIFHTHLFAIAANSSRLSSSSRKTRECWKKKKLIHTYLHKLGFTN